MRVQTAPSFRFGMLGLWLLTGCHAHASISSGGSRLQRTEGSASETQQRRSETNEVALEPAQQALLAAPPPEPEAPAEEVVPNPDHEPPPSDAAGAKPARGAKPEKPKASGRKDKALATTHGAAAEDHDRGHGNNPDHADHANKDNPAKAGKPKHASHKLASAEDHDRGHGNDADHVDQDNPGKSKGKKN